MKLKEKRVSFCKIDIKPNGIAKLDNELIFFCHVTFKPERLVNIDIIPGTSLLPSKSLEIVAYLMLGIYRTLEQPIISFS